MRRPNLIAQLCYAVVLLGLGPKAFGDEASAAKLRPLSAREGRAIVQKMAWGDDEEGLAPDCSHLVHALYEQAGYPYPYASSLDLYRGAGHFVRVRMPQPGDLIVWPGHVGVVVNPVDHSFFSSVSLGPRTQDYSSAYWRARGHARFYRYLTSNPARSSGRLSASNRPPERQPRAQADSGSKADGPALQPVKSASAAKEKTGGETPAASAARAHGTLQIALRTGGRPPQAADVGAALTEANLGAGEILRASDLEQLEQPVVVYQDLQVGAVEIRGKRGTAQVQVETLATLSSEGMEFLQGREEHKLELQRTKKGWMVTPPMKNVYVPRDAALRVLASRLASLTQNAVAGAEKEREQADIVRFMNLLIE